MKLRRQPHYHELSVIYVAPWVPSINITALSLCPTFSLCSSFSRTRPTHISVAHHANRTGRGDSQGRQAVHGGRESTR